jgi:hypothetical protein
MNSAATAYTVKPSVVAATLVVSACTVRRMCALGELPCLRVRGRWRIAEDWIAWMAERAARQAEECAARKKARALARAKVRARRIAA